MYKVQFLPSAQNDLIEIVQYIAVELHNKQAADKLADEIFEATKTLAEFPYAYPAYMPLRPTKFEYRKMSVRNYLLFYTVDEREQSVTIARVVYAKRKYGDLVN